MSASFSIEEHCDHYSGHFSAMASPCELLVDSKDKRLATRLTGIAFDEAKRIEQKFSRYLENNIMSEINSGSGKSVPIDNETYRLLDFANTCYALSEGMFDITSGVLRRAWVFNGSDRFPSRQDVKQLLPKLGWKQVQFDQNNITLPPGFELDFGGIGKEYAVDSVAKLCEVHAPDISVLVNFGGDIQVTCPRKKAPYWQVGIESPSELDTGKAIVKIARGGLATSGDARRFLLKGGIRYSHILNPKNGYPIANAPRSVTVAADHCIQSGLFATLALLQGEYAESFLKQQNLIYWCFW